MNQGSHMLMCFQINSVVYLKSFFATWCCILTVVSVIFHYRSLYIPQVCTIVWPQLKLRLYDFSHLQITGEVDNRRGTGRFFWKFLLCGHISYGLRSTSLNDIVRCPADVTRMKPLFTCNELMYIINY